MFQLRDSLLVTNRRRVDEYLTSRPIISLEHILRSTKIAAANRPHPELARIVAMFDKEEEERLTRTLTSVAYEVDGAETVGLITGPGRIERVSTIYLDFGRTKRY